MANIALSFGIFLGQVFPYTLRTYSYRAADVPDIQPNKPPPTPFLAIEERIGAGRGDRHVRSVRPPGGAVAERGHRDRAAARQRTAPHRAQGIGDRDETAPQ